MRYILFITVIFFVSSCVRQPLNVYSPHPVNTVIVKEDGDAGLNLTFFGNGLKSIGEDRFKSTGFNAQSKVVVYNGFFIEASTSFLDEMSSRKPDSLLPFNIYGASNNKTNYTNTEFGVGKILKTGANSNFILDFGIGKTKSKSNYVFDRNISIQTLNLSFINQHIYLGFMYQYSGDLVKEQFGFKYNLTKFDNIAVDNNIYYDDVIQDLKQDNYKYRSFLQVYQNLGFSPFKKQPWLSMHLHLGINFRNNLTLLAKARTFTSGVSIMASPSKILKRKK